MELSCPNRIITSCHFSNVPQRPSLLSAASTVLPVKNKRLRAAVVGDCGSCGAEQLEVEEWSEMLKWGDDKCRGSSNGVVELLECLEREAIMGEDEGTEAVDYNRRAQIFDKSARVFQALKHQAEAEHVERRS